MLKFDTLVRCVCADAAELWTFAPGHTLRHQPIAVIGGRCQSRAVNLSARYCGSWPCNALCVMCRRWSVVIWRGVAAVAWPRRVQRSSSSVAHRNCLQRRRSHNIRRLSRRHTQPRRITGLSWSFSFFYTCSGLYMPFCITRCDETHLKTNSLKNSVFYSFSNNFCLILLKNPVQI